MNIQQADKIAMERIAPYVREAEEVAFYTTNRVLEAFRAERVSETHFAGSTGYGYGDRGRDTLDQLFARALEAEDCLVRPQFISGTHTLTVALFGVLRPGDIMLAVTGKPYDTLDEVIGLAGNDGDGSLKDYGIEYRQVELKDGGLDFDAIEEALKEPRIKMVFLQKSKGYQNRPTLSAVEIGKVAHFAHELRPEVIVMVDNCYGEFCEMHEPTYYGVDMMAGSLIKNPGGGIAPTGGYIAGRKDLIELCSYRLTSPGIGRESGCTLGVLRELYQGLFMAPHVVLQAKKTAMYAAAMFEQIDCVTAPSYSEPRYDIIQTISLGTPEGLLSFCKGIQSGSPVDSFVTPEAWEMPGYDAPVVMAAGAFVMGASIELSADGPMKPPYTAFMQGGLTFESGRLGIMRAFEEISE
ncbi:MAG: methionine gamma-lyase family protein [Clostridia bacterium]|nr:methionine gamma-lyase family protein [Clostridia bacterium]